MVSIKQRKKVGKHMISQTVIVNIHPSSGEKACNNHHVKDKHHKTRCKKKAKGKKKTKEQLSAGQIWSLMESVGGASVGGAVYDPVSQEWNYEKGGGQPGAPVKPRPQPGPPTPEPPTPDPPTPGPPQPGGRPDIRAREPILTEAQIKNYKLKAKKFKEAWNRKYAEAQLKMKKAYEQLKKGEYDEAMKTAKDALPTDEAYKQFKKDVAETLPNKKDIEMVKQNLKDLKTAVAERDATKAIKEVKKLRKTMEVSAADKARLQKVLDEVKLKEWNEVKVPELKLKAKFSQLKTMTKKQLDKIKKRAPAQELVDELNRDDIPLIGGDEPVEDIDDVIKRMDESNAEAENQEQKVSDKLVQDHVDEHGELPTRDEFNARKAELDGKERAYADKYYDEAIDRHSEIEMTQQPPTSVDKTKADMFRENDPEVEMIQTHTYEEDKGKYPIEQPKKQSQDQRLQGELEDRLGPDSGTVMRTKQEYLDATGEGGKGPMTRSRSFKHAELDEVGRVPLRTPPTSEPAFSRETSVQRDTDVFNRDLPTEHVDFSNRPSATMGSQHQDFFREWFEGKPHTIVNADTIDHLITIDGTTGETMEWDMKGAGGTPVQQHPRQSADKPTEEHLSRDTETSAPHVEQRSFSEDVDIAKQFKIDDPEGYAKEEGFAKAFNEYADKHIAPEDVSRESWKAMKAKRVPVPRPEGPAETIDPNAPAMTKKQKEELKKKKLKTKKGTKNSEFESLEDFTADGATYMRNQRSGEDVVINDTHTLHDNMTERPHGSTQADQVEAFKKAGFSEAHTPAVHENMGVKQPSVKAGEAAQSRAEAGATGEAPAEAPGGEPPSIAKDVAEGVEDAADKSLGKGLSVKGMAKEGAKGLLYGIAGEFVADVADKKAAPPKGTDPDSRTEWEKYRHELEAGGTSGGLALGPAGVLSGAAAGASSLAIHEGFEKAFGTGHASEFASDVVSGATAGALFVAPLGPEAMAIGAGIGAVVGTAEGLWTETNLKADLNKGWDWVKSKF